MSRSLLDAIASLEGSERLVAFATGLRVGYTHLGDQWITFVETPRGGMDQRFHPDAFAAYNYVLTLGLGETSYRIVEA
jgi:hypothetical protein